MGQTTRALTLTALLVGSLLAVAAAPAAASNHRASVSMDNQTSGGYTVTVDSVTLPDGGFVALHDASLSDGAVLESVVGSSAYLEAGTHENVTVRLDDPLSETGTLVAMPHTDDGDRIYEFVSANANADGPYTMDGGAVTDAANVTVSAAVSMSAQPTDGTHVVVDRAELSQPGFLAVHNESLLDGEVTGSVVGHSEYLDAGVHEDVRVELDAPVENETVIPMPHMDTNGDEAYRFVESGGETDGPFLNAGGSAVLDTAPVENWMSASVAAANATTGGHHVGVDSVFLPEGGFVTVHDATVTEGQVFESIRGTSEYLGPGLHRNVTVALDDPLNESGTVVPMAHMDTDGNEAYTFPESEGETDGPYTADGGAVIDTSYQTVSASAEYAVQESDGHTVTVESVDLSQGGFVAIHDASLAAGEVTGSVVGHSEYLDAGYHEDVTVTLSTPLNESGTVIAMPHMDTNDDMAYTFPESGGNEDGPFTADSAAVVSAAKTLVQATVVADAQENDGTSVTVDSVTLHDGGFVTVHDATLTEGQVFESVRGTSEYLGPGTHTNVTVTLDEPLSGTNTVYAMAHADTDGDMAYSFVESEGASDGPYTAAGAPVMADAQVEAPAMTTAASGEPTEEPTTTTAEETTTADGTTETTESGGTPGFGVGAALAALLAAGALALRRR
jgi:PGF-CTERM protein